MAATATLAATLPRTKTLLISSIRTTITPAIKTHIISGRKALAGPTISSILPSLFSTTKSKSTTRTRTFCFSSSSSSSSSPIVAEDSNPNPSDENSVNGEVVQVDPIKEAADALDIRVGRVLKAWRHPEADSLYVEEVDVGEAEPRTICSGLVNYIPVHQIQDSNVVVLANLKPRNMCGIKSNGMLMAASDAAHESVELLKPPEGSVPGERIWFGSEEEKDQQSDAASPNKVQKKKIWEAVQPHLKTTDTCVAVLGERPMRTSAGVVSCSTLKSANIS